MDTLFLTLLVFTLMVAVLTIGVIAEAFTLTIARSRWWREMPRGTIPRAVLACLSIMSSGALVGILLFCVFYVLSYAGLVTALMLGAFNLISARYLLATERELPPMATRIDHENPRDLRS